MDSHPYLLLAIEHHHASAGDYTKRAARRELYEKSLRLTFNKSAVKGGFENRQVINSELLTDNKLLKEQDFIILANVDKNKILWIAVRELKDKILLTMIKDLLKA